MTTSLVALPRSACGTVSASPHGGQYFPALDGLRAIAFLMVFAEHYLQIPWGWAGVDVFFVLSGFLITGILFDTRDAPHRVRNFYLRRTLRIFPLYFGLMALLLLTWPVYRWQWSWAWLAWPAYLGNFARFLPSATLHSPMRAMADGALSSAARPWVALNVGHFWSLCVEEQFYLIWPWLVFWIKDRRRLLFVCIACVIACPLLRAAASYALPQYMLDAEVLYRATPFRLDALLLGGLIALILRGTHARRMLTAARVGFATLAPFAMIGVLIGLRASMGIYVYPAWRFTWGLVLVDVLAACVLVMALEPGSVAYRVLHLHPLRRLGRISYGAYVFHDIFHIRCGQITQHLIQRLHLPETYLKQESAALALASTVLLAWASFRWFEMPFIQLKSRLTRESSTHLVIAAPRRVQPRAHPMASLYEVTGADGAE